MNFDNYQNETKTMRKVDILKIGKLASMMFFQYMMFAVWWVPLAAYLTNANVSSIQKSLILSSMAIGCMASPVIGMIADRFFPGQKVLSLLNLINAGMLFLAGLAGNPDLLFVCMLIAMLCYMPTWGLTSSIAMANSTSEQFPRIRVFGSIGWVVSGVISVIVVNYFKMDFDGTKLPFFFAAGISLIAVIINLFLPNTPPPAKGKKASLIDAFGFRTVKLMKERNFFIFIVFSFLSMIPFSMYFSYCSEFLLDKDFKYISITMNWGQFAEMFFLLTIPFMIKKFGLRQTMILGLVAMLIRYVSFYAGSASEMMPFYFVGILTHGLIFGYFYLGGQIYIDKKAPLELRSQAQGFIFFVTFGLGLLIGNFINGQLINIYSETIDSVRKYDWNAIWGITTFTSLVLLVLFLILFKNEKAITSVTSS